VTIIDERLVYHRHIFIFLTSQETKEFDVYFANVTINQACNSVSGYGQCCLWRDSSTQR